MFRPWKRTFFLCSSALPPFRCLGIPANSYNLHQSPTQNCTTAPLQLAPVPDDPDEVISVLDLDEGPPIDEYSTEPPRVAELSTDVGVEYRSSGIIGFDLVSTIILSFQNLENLA